MDSDVLIAELETKYDISESAREYLAAVELDEEYRLRTGAAGRLSPDAIWCSLKVEVFEILCQKSPKYMREREALKHSVTPAVGLLSSWLTSKFGMEAGAASGLAAVALLIPLKLSLNAWCDAAKAEDWMTETDRKTLKQLGSRSKRYASRQRPTT